MSAAVGPFAVDEGLIQTVADGETTVRIHNTNTRKIIVSRFAVVTSIRYTTSAAMQAELASTSAAVMLLLVAAHAEGLGGCWMAAEILG